MRGTAAGEGVVSQANTDAFREGHDRIFGGKGPQRGSWVQDPETGELVDAASYVPPSHALDAPICVGRFYEGVPSPIDGHVFTGRTDYREYMRARGLTNASDYDKPGGEWDRAEARRQRGIASDPGEQRRRQEAISEAARRAHSMSDEGYRRHCREVERRRRERGPGVPTE